MAASITPYQKGKNSQGEFDIQDNRGIKDNSVKKRTVELFSSEKNNEFVGMNVLCISGSYRKNSSNVNLLMTLARTYPKISFEICNVLAKLPIFTADADRHPLPTDVLLWRKKLSEADALIICTPEYIKNVPAVIKNALEWVTSSGELSQKPVLPITLTPQNPRGEKAMQSLLWSLQALEARIVAQLSLFRNELNFDDRGNLIESDSKEMLNTAIELLIN